MASAILNNWVFEKGEAREKDIKALAKAKKYEERLKRQGYRWIKINERLKVFVPCDKDGNPTLEGQYKIHKLKENQGIK